ncbi:MAG: hypothetical protein LBF68_07670 [Christensenellaceae bacterium]|jgi:hypothetical protein|nr:hypothetical protein [Christensenellaceae bacterium]
MFRKFLLVACYSIVFTYRIYSAEYGFTVDPGECQMLADDTLVTKAKIVFGVSIPNDLFLIRKKVYRNSYKTFKAKEQV